MPFMFENLEVYQKGIDLVDRITNLTSQFPKGYYYLTDQLMIAVIGDPIQISGGGDWITNWDHPNFRSIT